MRIGLGCVMAVLVMAAGAYGTLTVPGADGSDGAFVFVPDAGNANLMTIDLGAAPTGTWNGTNSSPGNGVYDPDKWAVVFRYSSVNIDAGKTVTFKNNASRAPVVWLVSGSVTISGTVSLDGKGYAQQLGNFGEPGPGGFRGGSGSLGGSAVSSAGFGPGGGAFNTTNSYGYSNGGSYGTVGYGPLPGKVYGSGRIVPLIGGSGGCGRLDSNCDAPGAGGAILIVTGGTLTLNGRISAEAAGYFYSGGASGGAVRIVADVFAGNPNGGISCLGSNYGAGNYPGGVGRIRVEANSSPYAGTQAPEASFGAPGNPPVVWPEDSTIPVPAVKITQIAQAATPADPHAGMGVGNQDVSLSDTGPVTVKLAATNVPADWNVYVRIVPRYGQDFTVNASRVSGDDTSSVYEAQVTLPLGRAALQARAYKP